MRDQERLKSPKKKKKKKKRKRERERESRSKISAPKFTPVRLSVKIEF